MAYNDLFKTRTPVKHSSHSVNPKILVLELYQVKQITYVKKNITPLDTKWKKREMSMKYSVFLPVCLIRPVIEIDISYNFHFS